MVPLLDIKHVVEKGFYQIPNFDYNETFSPVVKPMTICMLLTIVVMKGWSIRQLDVNNAFLLETSQRINDFMEQPFSFEVYSSQPTCHLKKAYIG